MIWWSNYKSLCKIGILGYYSAEWKLFEISSPPPASYIYCQGFLSIIRTLILGVCFLLNWRLLAVSMIFWVSANNQAENAVLGEYQLVQIRTWCLFTCWGIGWYVTWNENGTWLQRNQHSWFDRGWESWYGSVSCTYNWELIAENGTLGFKSVGWNGVNGTWHKRRTLGLCMWSLSEHCLPVVHMCWLWLKVKQLKWQVSSVGKIEKYWSEYKTPITSGIIKWGTY